jgi:hypothetical protein
MSGGLATEGGAAAWGPSPEPLPTLRAGGFAAASDAGAWEPDPAPGVPTRRLWLVSLVGRREAVLALWARLIKGETLALAESELGPARACRLAGPDVAGTWKLYQAPLPAAGGSQAVLVPEVALHGAERPDFLLLPRRPAEAAALYYRFLNRRVGVPLHPSWAAWLWDRARSDGEAETLEAWGLAAYRCRSEPARLAADVAVALRRGTLPIPEPTGQAEPRPAVTQVDRTTAARPVGGTRP